MGPLCATAFNYPEPPPDPPRLVLGQDLGLPSFGIVVAGVEVRQRLPVGVQDDIAAGHRIGVPGRREAALRFCHTKNAEPIRNHYSAATVAVQRALARPAIGRTAHRSWTGAARPDPCKVPMKPATSAVLSGERIGRAAMSFRRQSPMDALTIGKMIKNGAALLVLAGCAGQMITTGTDQLVGQPLKRSHHQTRRSDRRADHRGHEGLHLDDRYHS
jgi:hypothetical protein